MADYWKAEPSVQDKMLELVGQHHPDLAEVSEEGIVVVFRDKATKGAPYGTVRKVSGCWGALIPDNVVFVIELPKDVHEALDAQGRAAILDHWLCACRGDFDDKTGKTKYYIAKADIMAYRENLERFGNWFPKPSDDADDDDESVSIVDLLDDDKG